MGKQSRGSGGGGGGGHVVVNIEFRSVEDCYEDPTKGGIKVYIYSPGLQSGRLSKVPTGSSWS